LPSAHRAQHQIAARRAEDRRALPAVSDRLRTSSCGCKSWEWVRRCEKIDRSADHQWTRINPTRLAATTAANFFKLLLDCVRCRLCRALDCSPVALSCSALQLMLGR